MVGLSPWKSWHITKNFKAFCHFSKSFWALLSEDQELFFSLLNHIWMLFMGLFGVITSVGGGWRWQWEPVLGMPDWLLPGPMERWHLLVPLSACGPNKVSLELLFSLLLYKFYQVFASAPSSYQVGQQASGPVAYVMGLSGCSTDPVEFEHQSVTQGKEEMGLFCP